MINRMCVCWLAMLLMTVLTLAQPDPNARQPVGGANQPRLVPMIPPDARNTTIEATPNGFFVLCAAVLAKYDAQTLQPQGVLELLDPLPPMPKAQGDQPVDQRALDRWLAERYRRLSPSAMLAQEDSLYLVCGNLYFRVNQQTMKVEVKATIQPVRDPKVEQPVVAFNSATPLLKFAAGSLYLFRGGMVLALDPATGKVLGQAALPKETLQVLMPDQPRMVQPQPPMIGGEVGGEERELTVVGAIIQVELEGGFWAVRDDHGNEYVLEGERLKGLTATPQITKKRVRITGKFSTHPGAAMYGKGYLRITEYQVLPDAPAEG